MCSQKQHQANRLNALKSTGPKSEEGKLRSSQNALKHGLCSPSLLPTESSSSYENFSAEMLAELQPLGPIETDLAQRITHLTWRLRRLPAAEAELFHQLDLRHQGDEPLTPAQHLAIAFATQDDKTNPFLRLQRYERHLQRSLELAIRQLAALQHRRRANEQLHENFDEDQVDEHLDDQPGTTNNQLQTTNQLPNEPISPPSPATADMSLNPPRPLHPPHVQRILREAVLQTSP
jgi:hypothetical protein